MAKKKEVQKPQGGRNAYQAVKTETQQTNIEGDLLRFTKQGDWVAGLNEDEIPEGTELIIGMNTFSKGWQKWEDQKPTQSKMGLVRESYQPALREELGDLDEDEWEEVGDPPQKRDPWQYTMMCQMMDPKTKQVYTFSTSSKSGQTAIGAVSGAYGDRLQDGGDADEMPIASLESDSYKHSQYGKIMIPVFKLTGKWVKPPAIKPSTKSETRTTEKAADKPARKAAKGAPDANSRSRPKALAPPPRKPQASRGTRI